MSKLILRILVTNKWEPTSANTKFKWKCSLAYKMSKFFYLQRVRFSIAYFLDNVNEYLPLLAANVSIYSPLKPPIAVSDGEGFRCKVQNKEHSRVLPMSSYVSVLSE